MNAPTPGTTLGKNAYFPALTGVRALAAWLIFLHHLPTNGNYTSLVNFFLDGSNIGVTIFFVLSGFLISYRYAETLTNRGISFKNYLWRRFARIYPLYLVITIFTLCYDRNFSLFAWILNLTLLKSFFSVEIGTGIVQGWSLTVEETFYLLAPLLFIGFRKLKLGSVCGLIIIGVGIVFIAQKAGSTNFMSDYELMLSNTFFGRCFEFYCGYYLSTLMKNNKYQITSGAAFTVTSSIVLLISIFLIGFSQQLKFIFPFPVPVSALINNFILPIVISCWFYGLLTEKTILNHLLSTRIFQVLGKSSYAFYLIHLGWFPEAIYFHIYPSILSMFVFLNVLAIALYYLFEKPVNSYLLKKHTKFSIKNTKRQEAAFTE